MALKDLEILLDKRDLVCQSDNALQRMHLATNEGELQLSKDGCAVVTLYNALRLNNFSKSFEDFTTDLVNNKCLEHDGLINWKKFNTLQNGLEFTWMQDAEMPSCDPVNVGHLSEWVSSGNIAIAKVQSLFAKDRRHFMVALGIEDDTVVCLESSDDSGVPKLRNIKGNEILGVRYFIASNNNVQGNSIDFPLSILSTMKGYQA